MSHDIYMGIDNGVSGAIGIITLKGSHLFKMPTKSELSYTKTKQNITRIVVKDLMELISTNDPAFVLMERPMVNPGRFKATMSAMRALEATLISLEMVKLPFAYIDSKEWQKALLPKGLEKEELKTASLDIGKRLFPNINFKGFKDADAILIARYAQLKGY